MTSFITALGILASQNHFLAYFIFYIGIIFLGSIAEFTGFWLVFRGFFGPWAPIIFPVVIILSSVTGDLLWYSFGRSLKETRFGNFVKNRLPNYSKIEGGVQKNGAHWIFFSRFVYASAFPVLFSVGWAGMHFKKFFKLSFISNLLWAPILTGVAYSLTLSLTPLESLAVFKEFEIVLLIGIVSFLILNYFAMKLIRLILKRIESGLAD